MERFFYSGLVAVFLLGMDACGEAPDQPLEVGEIVARAIEAAGGERYGKSHIEFEFRDRTYSSHWEDGRQVLKRITTTDTAVIVDTRKGEEFERTVGDSVVAVPDSMAGRYSRSVNAVHYFAYLPHGLDGRAVNKELLGIVELDGKSYYKVRVTFDQQGGGEDYQDIFVYWFDTETFRPGFLAYEYYTDGGGLRFREGYNDRTVGGLKFLDYRNFKTEASVPVTQLDSLFELGELEELSVIELRNISVNQDNYN